MKYASLRQGLVGAWCPSLGPSGNTLLDRSGYGNHGTLTNMDAGTDWVGSRYGWALDFDGSNDRIDLGQMQPISTTGAFTLSAWINVRAFSNNFPAIAQFRTNAGAFIFAISRETFIPNYLGMLFGSDNVTWGRFRNALPESTWVGWRHIAYTYIGANPTDAASYRTYLDGADVSVTTAAAFGARADASFIANENTSGGFPFNGLIDDVRLYSRNVPPADIRLLATESGIGLKPERTSVFFGADLFSAAWLSRQSTIIGGGVA